MYNKNIGLFFHVSNLHTAAPSVKMVDALATYISNYEFQFKFSLKKMVNFTKK